MSLHFSRQKADVIEPCILFLNFDGVLHPPHAERDQLFCQRHLLWAVVDTCHDVEVVFSTTWRTGFMARRAGEPGHAGWRRAVRAVFRWRDP
jgi:hypothetical protein